MVVTYKYRSYDVLLSRGGENIYIKMTNSNYGQSFEANVDSAQLGISYELYEIFSLMCDAFEQRQVEITRHNDTLEAVFEPFSKRSPAYNLYFKVTLTYCGTTWHNFLDERFTRLEETMLKQSTEIHSLHLLLETSANDILQMQTKLDAMEHTLKKNYDISLPSEFFVYDEYVVVTLFKPEDKSIYIKMTNTITRRYELTFDPSTLDCLRDPETMYKLITETLSKKNKDLTLRICTKNDEVVKLKFRGTLGGFFTFVKFDLVLPKLV